MLSVPLASYFPTILAPLHQNILYFKSTFSAMGNSEKNDGRICLASAKEVILKKPAELKAKNTPNDAIILC